MAALKLFFQSPRQLLSGGLIKHISLCNHTATPRFFSITTPSFLKEIRVQTENDVTIVEGCYIETDKNKKLFEPTNEACKDFCPLCPNRLDVTVKYTDVLILSQFLRPDGCALPRHVTGLCRKAQNRLLRLVHQAQRAGLMPEFRPDRRDGLPRDSLKSRYKWRKYNIYYDE